MRTDSQQAWLLAGVREEGPLLLRLATFASKVPTNSAIVALAFFAIRLALAVVRVTACAVIVVVVATTATAAITSLAVATTTVLLFFE
ncbi:hypothetical protein E2562_019597 [Oryza meyeriana var. granulata]|uniref:Uncharacterized protein n=1 Tax=Oryza meyeriana var. granulata TaxID=110450 RepID=A0A6G1EXD9_9ORYZ|nr:hypothetical protein E2562_019597 [Oryza meyeriana var. granulata]